MHQNEFCERIVYSNIFLSTRYVVSYKVQKIGTILHILSLITFNYTVLLCKLNDSSKVISFLCQYTRFV